MCPVSPPVDDADADPATDLTPLGDMVISLERAKAQAEEYGHPVERELSYLAVHSVLHLLGYDHMDEGPQKAQMRAPGGGYPRRIWALPGTGKAGAMENPWQR